MKLSEIAWDTLTMAIRYAIPRRTISCCSLPGEIARSYGSILTDSQRAFLVLDIRRELDSCRQFQRNDMWEQIDAPEWEALADALDPTKHYEVTTRYEGKEETHVCFEHEGKSVVVADYLKTGKRRQYVNPDYII